VREIANQAVPVTFAAVPSDAPPSRPHLAAALWALLLATVPLAAGLWWAQRLERRHVHDLITDFSDPKLHGVALQKQAFAQDDLLVLYGSSELIQEVPNTAGEFFEEYPTGFRVFPVGKAGTTALAVLQKLAAVGEDLRGKKVAISLSPSSYFAEEVDPGYYAGNFSALQATELALSPSLSRALRRDAARRMLEYPKTLADDWLLRTLLQRLARDTPADRALFAALQPLSHLQRGIGRVQDHFATAGHLDERHPEPERVKRRQVLNWTQIFKRAEEIAQRMKATARKPPALTRRPKGSRDRQFLQTLARADEWTDLELMLRALDELGAQPLILSMPLHARDLETTGVSETARSAYETRLRKVTAEHGAPLVYFRQNENDPDFFSDNLDHLGAKGWAYYNQKLDDFFHGRLAGTDDE
jgi:D-alanine transfer protein